MSRRETLEALKAHAFGRRFILNLAYCESNKLWPPSMDVGDVLDEIVRRLEPLPAAEWIVRGINEVLRDHYHPHIPFSEPFGMPHHDQLFRVVPKGRFTATLNGLLSAEGLDALGLLVERTDDVGLRLFAHDAVDPTLISPSARIRGYHPFAWAATSDPRLTYILRRAPENENRAGRLLCRLLALDGFGETEPLFLMRYPAVAGGISIRRPNALDGFGNTFFKARTGADTATATARSGFTLDLYKIARIDLMENPMPTCDGVPEYAVEPMPFSEQFSLQWIGYFQRSWVTSADADIESVIAGTADVKRAVDEAIDMLDRI